MSFEPLRVLRLLTDAGVRFVVVGGMAGRLWGSPTVTGDIDICPSRDGENLDRLAGVLQSLDARLRGVDDDVPFLLDGGTLLAGDSFTFTTTAGDVDVIGTPEGTTGFEDLVHVAAEFELDGFSVLVADLGDLIRMKRAAGRPKDLIEVEVLEAVRNEVEAEGNG
jgi:hypothetical protein